MSNRRVKSLAIDENDYDDNEEDDYDDESNELNEEDKEHLRLGTIEVRSALGPTFQTSDNEIQEALWHYYYDVGKSVSYLKNKHKPPSTPTKKPKDNNKISALLPDNTTTLSTKDFFVDCPWMQIPPDRQALIIEQPLTPRFRLLGGASKEGKISKLAALAAKRRQQDSQRSSNSETTQTSSEENYADTLSKLRISQPVKPGKKDTKIEITHPVTNNDETTRPETSGAESHSSQVHTTSQPVAIQDIRGRPSAFASVLVSNTTEKHSTQSLSFLDNEFRAKAFDFAEPSPDDIVSKAQNSKATTVDRQKPEENVKQGSELRNGVANLTIQDSSPKTKSKNIDVIAEYKKVKRKNAANFVVIGHVDAGKSTLMGRLLFDLKAVDQRTMDKYKKEAERIGKGSFAFAWVLDQGSEERARGVTIDIATNKFETAKTSFTILDAPGHRDFVPNMIAGASQADFAVLVVDASTGNFESGLKGQTKEHALLVRSIGVQRIIVAVNKMDAANWSQERFNEIQQQMSGFLNSAGFQSKNVSFVPCSGLEGTNILQKVDKATAPWYNGDTLVEELDKSEPTSYALEKPLRMTISDVFRGGIQNPLSVSGRIEAGNLQVGNLVTIMPSGEKASIRSLEVDDEPSEWAVAGLNVVLHLTDIDPVHLKTGDVLCSTQSPIQNLVEFSAKLLAFEFLTPMNLDIHRGRLHVPGRLTQLVATLDKSSGEVVKKKPKIVQPGTVVRVKIQLEQPVPLEAPARVVLRADGQTVAAGMIE